MPSKLTAIGTLIGFLSFATYLVEKGYGLSNLFNSGKTKIEDVYLVLEFNNKNQENLSLFQRGEVFFWYPGPGAYHQVYTFEIVHVDGSDELTENIVIPSKSKKKATVKLLSTVQVRNFLEQGHMDISLYIRGINIDGQFSNNIAFTKNNLDHAYLPIELKAKQP